MYFLGSKRKLKLNVVSEDFRAGLYYYSKNKCAYRTTYYSHSGEGGAIETSLAYSLFGRSETLLSHVHYEHTHCQAKLLQITEYLIEFAAKYIELVEERIL